MGVRLYESLDSTNSEAQRYLSSSNTNAASWILADKQDSGRGRMGSTWISDEGNLFCSLIYPITWELEILPMLSCLVAVSIHETLIFYIKENKNLKIKWPNDILIDDAKISGALIENIITSTKKYSIIGVGINIVNAPNIDIYKTSFINRYLERKVTRNEVFLKFKEIIEKKLKSFSRDSLSVLKKTMLSNAWSINKNIKYMSGAITGEGVFLNISNDYQIIIRDCNSQLINLSSGEIKIVRD